MKKTKQQKCVWSYPEFTGAKEVYYECLCSGEGKKIVETDCENCANYRCRYIEYPLTIQSLNLKKIENGEKSQVGKLCKIRPCKENSEKGTYLGIFLGRLPIYLHASFDENTGELACSTIDNPAIYVPELQEIIYGMESWWQFIGGEGELEEITDEDIENQWYVKLLKKCL